MDNDKMIIAKELTKIFGNLKAVDNLSLEIYEGEIFGLLGPNGAGKTTTVRMLSTVLKPTKGKAYVAGYDINSEANKVRKNIGYVTQDLAIDLNLTGYENLYINGRLLKIEKQKLKKKIEEILEFFNLKEHKNKLARYYSGGMRKKLDIACGLLNNPKVLFLDEPTLGLDVQTRYSIWDYIKKLKEKKITILLTTHYLEEADKLCDRIAIIDEGKIVTIGKPEELKKKIGKEIIRIILEENENIKKIANILEKFKWCINLNIYKNEIIINTLSIENSIKDILNLIKENKINIKGLNYSRASLDDVFLHFTKKKFDDSDFTRIERAIRRVRM